MFSDVLRARFLGWQILSLTLVPLSSCSVLDDRSDCPCYLTIDLPEDYERLYVSIWSQDGFEIEDMVVPSSCPSGYTLMVPRGKLWCSVATSDDWNIAEGEECARLYFTVNELDTSDEKVAFKPAMHKQFCLMTIVLLEAARGDGVMDVCMKGDVCGYDATGQPLPGPFLCHLESSFSSHDHCLDCRVPRQKASSLVLDVKYTSEVTMTLPVGLYLEESGYDWNALDLEDVTLEIDSRESCVVVKTDKWRKSLSFDLVI